MQKYIKVGTGDIFPVEDVYPYIYESGNGRQVIRIIVDPAVKTYQELFDMFNTGNFPIEEYWDEEQVVEVPAEGTTADGAAADESTHKTKTVTAKVKKSEHTYYCKEYKCSFNTEDHFPGKYFVEITRKTQSEITAEENQSAIDANSMAIADLYESTLSL